MSLKNTFLKREYRSLKDNIVQSFYLPLLKDAIVYKRAVGFFSSSSLIEISKGLCSVVQNKGKIQIIASPNLSPEDIEAIKYGYDKREIIKKSLERELSDDHEDYFSKERLNLLANLIADGILDFKIAYLERSGNIGMYHEKLGVIADNEGNKVAFSGSMNESETALSINYETIDVFKSWETEDEAERALLKEKAFDMIWNDEDPSLRVFDFPEVKDHIITKYKESTLNLSVDYEQYPPQKKELYVRETDEISKLFPKGARVPENVELREYQKDAIATWVSENYRGIYDMATGTGKTYTGLASAAKLSEDLEDKLALIIVCPYQHLVEQWIEDIIAFNIKPIIGYSSSSQKDWKDRLKKAIRDQKIRDDKQFFCFICTNATFRSDFVQEEISKIKSDILLMIDEAHNFGASSLGKLLDDRFKYRLALSATLDRHHDEEGTAFLYNFFGRKCIEYSLEKAIAENKLTPYKYYPIVVVLTDDELEKYEQLSYEMSKCIIKGRNGKCKLNKRGEILAIKRSRIIAGAIEKLEALRVAIQPYRHDNNILVYCGATSVLQENQDSSVTEVQDIRQIEAVTKLLGNELNMNVSRFTAEEDVETRAVIKSQFGKGELQAIVAIKCLDEGVNIPGIRTAFILASTTNPKEYIQRRGRVLRLADNKPFAEIYDFITLPRPLDTVSGLTTDQAQRDLTLVKNELARIIEFSSTAMNEMDSLQLIWDIKDTYHILNDEELGEENVGN